MFVVSDHETFMLFSPVLFWLTALLQTTEQQREDSHLQWTSKYFRERAAQRNTRFSRVYSLSIDVLSAHVSHPGSLREILFVANYWGVSNTNDKKSTVKDCFDVDIVLSCRLRLNNVNPNLIEKQSLKNPVDWIFFLASVGVAFKTTVRKSLRVVIHLKITLTGL